MGLLDGGFEEVAARGPHYRYWKQFERLVRGLRLLSHQLNNQLALFLHGFISTVI